MTEIITRYRKMLAPSPGGEGRGGQGREDFVRIYPTDYKNFPSSVLDRASALFSVVFTATVNSVRPRIKSHLCDYEPSAYVYLPRLFPPMQYP